MNRRAFLSLLILSPVVLLARKMGPLRGERFVHFHHIIYLDVNQIVFRRADGSEEIFQYGYVGWDHSIGRNRFTNAWRKVGDKWKVVYDLSFELLGGESGVLVIWREME